MTQHADILDQQDPLRGPFLGAVGLHVTVVSAIALYGWMATHGESFGGDETINGGLEYPQYTRPREFQGRAVPEILFSGNHGAVEAWRREQARIRTAQRRPDLVPES